MSISAVLPAYNEEAIIERTVRHVASVLAELTSEYEVIVTNDGSADRTGEILALLQEREPALNLQVVTHPTNYGYGAALASGFDAARKDLIFMTDGDKQFDVTELDALPPRDGRADGPGHRLAPQPRGPVHAQVERAGLEAAGQSAVRLHGSRRRLRIQAVPATRVGKHDGARARRDVLRRVSDQGPPPGLPRQRAAREPPATRTAGSPTGARPDVIVRAFAELFRLWRNLDNELHADPRARDRMGGGRGVAAV